MSLEMTLKTPVILSYLRPLSLSPLKHSTITLNKVLCLPQKAVNYPKNEVKLQKPVFSTIKILRSWIFLVVLKYVKLPEIYF
jgi:hypothetical protein